MWTDYHCILSVSDLHRYVSTTAEHSVSIGLDAAAAASFNSDSDSLFI